MKGLLNTIYGKGPQKVQICTIWVLICQILVQIFQIWKI
jgi:hypothetical protein